jgi:hypothetical protein
MRALILSITLFCLNMAFNLTIGKYGTNVPDVLIIVFWVLPALPLIWLAITHPKLIRHRHWYRERLQANTIATLLFTFIAICILAISIGGASYRVWKGISKPEVAKNNLPKPPASTSTPDPIIQVSFELTNLNIPVQPGDTLVSLVVLADGKMRGNRFHNDSLKMLLWPSRKHPPDGIDIVWKITISDLSTTEIFNVATAFAADSHDQQNGGKLFTSTTVNMDVPSISIDRPFSFYAINASKYFVELRMPQNVLAQLAGTSVIKSIPVVDRGLAGKLRSALFPPTKNKWNGWDLR